MKNAFINQFEEWKRSIHQSIWRMKNAFINQFDEWKHNSKSNWRMVRWWRRFFCIRLSNMQMKLFEFWKRSSRTKVTSEQYVTTTFWGSSPLPLEECFSLLMLYWYYIPVSCSCCNHIAFHYIACCWTYQLVLIAILQCDCRGTAVSARHWHGWWTISSWWFP